MKRSRRLNATVRQEAGKKPSEIFKRTALASAVSLACGSLPGVVLAEDAESADAMEEVIVTATRRANNLQDVPLSIQAITDETIETLTFRDLKT